MTKSYAIKESTRKRCRVIRLAHGELDNYRSVGMEQFHLLNEAPGLDFSIYVRVGYELIEYMKPGEFSSELLTNLWMATTKDQADIQFFVSNEEFPKFQTMINLIRAKKVGSLLKSDPNLNRMTVKIFQDLSAASRLVHSGKIDRAAAHKACKVASKVVDEVLSNFKIAGTLSKIILVEPTLYDHCASVAILSAVVAKQSEKHQFTKKQIETIILSGLFHDAGKTHIPSFILNKPGIFTESEYNVMKRHTNFGFREITNAMADGAVIDPVVPLVALEHHERMNGKGYPFGKAGRAEENPGTGIHLYSRIVSIADAYSALLMKRSYKKALTAEEALKQMTARADEHFDRDLFLPFAKHIRASLDLEGTNSDSPEFDSETKTYIYSKKNLGNGGLNIKVA